MIFVTGSRNLLLLLLFATFVIFVTSSHPMREKRGRRNILSRIIRNIAVITSSLKKGNFESMNRIHSCFVSYINLCSVWKSMQIWKLIFHFFLIGFSIFHSVSLFYLFIEKKTLYFDWFKIINIVLITSRINLKITLHEYLN